MADAWFRKLGFGRNPFSIKPAAFSYELFGVSIDSVLSGIEDGKVLFVEAPLGYGKTTMLKSIIHRFGGKRKVIYANILPSEKVDVKGLLKRSSVANYITGSLPQEMILVADEAQNILPESSAEIIEFYKSGNIRAVVFFGTRYSQDGFVDEIRSMMNGNIVRLSRPTPEQAISIVRSRIGNLPILPNEAILSAYVRANGSPRRLLQVCEDLCRSAVEKGRLVVSEEELSMHSVSTLKTSRPRQAKRASKKVRVNTSADAVKAKTTGAVKAKAANAIKGKGKAVKVKAKRKTAQKPRQNRQRQNKPKDKAPAPASASAAHAVSKPVEVTGTEGVYWGEFMGMQK